MAVYNYSWSIWTKYGVRPMARSGNDGPKDGPSVLPDTGLLSRAVRRDLFDLNLAYLEIGLAMVDADDPLVAWAPAVRSEIEVAGPAVRERMAECPFSLFKISLPVGKDANPDGPRVEDTGARSAVGVRAACCVEFSSTALFAAWRLADSAPLAARIVFGLTPAEECRLNELSPSKVAALAGNPNVVRARWPDRPRFWAALRSAAESATPVALQWAHCMGICLIEGGPTESRGPDPGAATGRRRR